MQAASTVINVSGWIIGAAILLLAVFLTTGCTTVGKPMRLPPEQSNALDAWYIQGVAKATDKQNAGKEYEYSCSFVEFDGRGDYIDFRQHRYAWEKAKKLAEKQKILLVIYCHGWKNNSQSGDVVEFNSFLGRLAASPDVGGFGYRVHGVYLSWRGNLFPPRVDKNDEDGFYAQTEREFGGPIVNDKYHRKFLSWLWVLPETLSYWSRRGAAEHEVSGVPIARTIFSCASATKAVDEKNGRTNLLQSSRVFVMGHSFGALMLEQAFSPACVGNLMEEMPWFDGSRPEQIFKNPLPFDFVLFVNSAAPAIYAKEMRDFLSAHHNSLVAAKAPHADAPVFISLTSSADKATGMVHPIGNLLAPLFPSLRRTYTDLSNNLKDKPVPQYAFYNRTPGHHPLLVDHWIVTNDYPKRTLQSTDHNSIFDENLHYQTENPWEFYTSPRKQGKNPTAKAWIISAKAPPEEQKWVRQFHEVEPELRP